jgi:uncharacterized NAD(P)/FAD-binding protein YdhS
LRVSVRRRQGGGPLQVEAAWVINCTGPLPSNRAESNPVVASLLAQGCLRPDLLALGIDTDEAGLAIDADGGSVDALYVVGTLRKPATWESAAVPELRVQAAQVARHLLGGLAVPVGGGHADAASS